MFCPECGKEVVEQAVFCRHCGASLKKEEESENDFVYETLNGQFSEPVQESVSESVAMPEKKSKKGMKTAITAICMVCVIAVCTVLFFILPGDKDQDVNAGADIAQTDASKADENIAKNEQTYEAYVAPESTEKQSETQHYTQSTQSTSEQSAENGLNGANLIDGMSAAERKDINTYFSNFSEAYFDNEDYYKTYEASEEHNYRLIDFAFIHNLINYSDNILYKNGMMGISASDANKSIERFFGVSVPLRSFKSTYGWEWVYEDESFWMPEAYGESYDYFSVVTDMRAQGDGTYIVRYNKYFAGYTFLTKDHYGYSVERANNECEFVHEVTAHVRPKDYKGRNSYEVISLEVNK